MCQSGEGKSAWWDGGLDHCQSKSFELVGAADDCESRRQYIESKGFRMLNIKGMYF